MTVKIAVDAVALRQVLQALIGPGHHIRELQATRSLHALGHPNPIDLLLEDYERHLADEAKVQACDHQWVSARNQYIQSGEICAKLCGAIRSEQPQVNKDKAS